MIIFWNITFPEFFLSALESEAFMLSKIIILYNIDSVYGKNQNNESVVCSCYDKDEKC